MAEVIGGFVPGNVLVSGAHQQYWLRERIATGGQADVWAGHGRVGEASVRVIVRVERRSGAALERAALLAELPRCAGLAEVIERFDSEAPGGVPVIVTVMHRVEGVALGRPTARRQAIGKLNVIGPVAEALDAMHAAGIIHGDVTPNNVMLQLNMSGVLFATLLDFGTLSKIGAERQGPAWGTPGYVSPSVLGGRALGPMDDIYSLSKLCVFLLGYAVPKDGRAPDPIEGNRAATELLADAHYLRYTGSATEWLTALHRAVTPGIVTEQLPTTQLLTVGEEGVATQPMSSVARDVTQTRYEAGVRRVLDELLNNRVFAFALVTAACVGFIAAIST